MSILLDYPLWICLRAHIMYVLLRKHTLTDWGASHPSSKTLTQRPTSHLPHFACLTVSSNRRHHSHCWDFLFLIAGTLGSLCCRFRLDFKPASSSIRRRWIGQRGSSVYHLLGQFLLLNQVRMTMGVMVSSFIPLWFFFFLHDKWKSLSKSICMITQSHSWTQLQFKKTSKNFFFLLTFFVQSPPHPPISFVSCDVHVKVKLLLTSLLGNL